MRNSAATSTLRAANWRAHIRIEVSLLWREDVMDLRSFVDKAKEAAAAVTEQAKSAMATPAPAPSPEGAEAAAAGANDPAPARDAPPPAAAAKSFADIANEKINHLSVVGGEKIQEMVTSFQQALPTIKSAGYELTEFEIELGVTPKLIPHFRYSPRSDEAVEGAREALRENKLGSLILGALLRAGAAHKQIKVAGFAFSHIEIELGLIPSVRLQYKNEDPPPNTDRALASS
jgi:hypothetical protein